MILNQVTFIWAGAAAVFVIGEMTVPHFGLLFAAIAAAIAGAVSIMTPNWEFQFIAFGLSLILGLGLLRPRLVRRLQSTKGVPSRTQNLIGKKAKVHESIDPLGGHGRVEVDGEDWAAKSTQAFPVGATVTIEGADGIVLTVKKG